ncbi:MAG: hypothetical protein HDR38_06130 [Treponema sp.]|nr:hypothetical protein [Treponema sp.]
MFVVRFRVGEAKNFCSLFAFALGSEQIFVCWSLLRWGSNKFLFVACFRAGEAKNFCLLAAFALGEQKIFVRCLLSRWGTNKFLFVVRFCVWADSGILSFGKNVAGRVLLLEVDAGGAGF